MGKLIIGVAALMACAALAFSARKDTTTYRTPRIVGAGIAGILGIILFAVAFAHPVAAGNVGVITVFGKPQDNVATEGLNFMPPFYDVVQLSKRTQSVDSTTAAFTSDLQQADVTSTVMFHLPPASAVNVFRNYGRDYADTIVIPVYLDTIKATVGAYTANTVVSQRSELAMAVREEFSARMKAYGIEVDDVAITNIDFTDQFEQSVEDANKAHQDTLRVKEEAEQMKAKAEGEAAAKKAAADAEAYQITTVAQAQAEANRVLAESLTPELIESQKIEKWNGTVPTVSGPGATIVDIGGITDSDN